MARTAVLGFPRIGANRELKSALEEYWAGRSDAGPLEAAARDVRATNLITGREAGIEVLPVGDFALYDHVRDAAEMAGIVAERHGGPQASGLDAHFLACRGGEGVAPLEMTKWFDTNYHYLVPELAADQDFRLQPDKWLAHLSEAAELGVPARPVALGPLSLLLLSKGVCQPLSLLPELTSVYAELLAALGRAGASEVQLDEPCLVLDRSEPELDAFRSAYSELGGAARIELCLATYFGELDKPALRRVAELPLAELHVDLVRAPGQLDVILEALPVGARLSAGVIDGRNVWAADLDVAMDRLDRVVAAIGSERLTIASSCSLMHVPYTVAGEDAVPAEVRDWLAFGREKLGELSLLARAVDAAPPERDELLSESRRRASARRVSELTNDAAVRRRVAALTEGHYSRTARLGERRALQHERLGLPELPTTTIGSFPQTAEIREARRRRRVGELDEGGYERFLLGQIEQVVREQERLGLDVLVHGEPERNDMVEYFGEQLKGFAFTRAGWVQSYGSRCVKPPILFGDVSRAGPMTVRWWQAAQSMTDRPMKGMLTGPVTILQWSFVRDDQPRSETCTQIALAIQDEVLDLEAAGASLIQVDEPALREGLPLRRRDQDDYVRWAIDCFRLAVAPAAPETQVHTHMCYSEFGEMIEHIARLDADVLSIEASRSGMELLDVFRDFEYPGEIGPGIYDIHSPRVPTADELDRLLELAERRIGRERLWVNPDCGLKTRAWPETRAALANMIEVARQRRAAQPAARA
jgi:5-methyltetrahydropteroyltriglutamate--homocysteine methyltransferase